MDDDLPALIFSATPGAQSREARALRRDAAAGRLVRVQRGVYVPSEGWARLKPWRRHVVRVRAAVAALPADCVVSHGSAVAVHGLPSVQGDPPRVHVIDRRRASTQTTPVLVKHAGGLEEHEVERVGDLLVTSELRTAYDVARSSGFDDGVLCLDGVMRRRLLVAGRLPRVDEMRARVDDLRDEFRLRFEVMAGRTVGRRGEGALERALSFATPLSENGGESLVRVALHRLGAPQPVLQEEFFDARGFVGRCDFFFADFGLVLEFDGFGKYSDPRMLAGSSPAEVVRREKKREAQLLGTGRVRRVERCDIDDVLDPRRLAAIVRRGGVPLRSGRASASWS
ncbi:hypothetical protein [Frigoribacterium sp. Leaf186]|uniref:hypothetical protein n=1 Tax=Frigoribacterium sp. Leaf186 TaxID=1736293 RepID=UPI0006F90657|nr:hypothetical protein [Frigoribacterium sp. Leaf186]KQS16223.1 hypothetical protein ASG05_10515 [Frigoribacterium sp. Leaf186]